MEWRAGEQEQKLSCCFPVSLSATAKNSCIIAVNLELNSCLSLREWNRIPFRSNDSTPLPWHKLWEKPSLLSSTTLGENQHQAWVMAPSDAVCEMTNRTQLWSCGRVTAAKWGLSYSGKNRPDVKALEGLKRLGNNIRGSSKGYRQPTQWGNASLSQN